MLNPLPMMSNGQKKYCENLDMKFAHLMIPNNYFDGKMLILALGDFFLCVSYLSNAVCMKDKMTLISPFRKKMS